ncbi:ferritin-like domain-containing protein [Mycobacterium sherrisii]|uniref:ferritin-like domain-containing protein n=1 Tax=Mycobacterium sherrisii TaxID=243061 RepID=UPI000A148116|nr:ferritin-like domain-containing protein [Mycobacterium sherrisii]MCV7028438.1 ferritin-like domain-containing protein [Mycobacterium sherrisii]ORW76214.1 aminobenzoate oxygenase [Mycobacterium sherrisii]
MTTREKYTEVPTPYSWQVSSAGDARFTWEYDDGRARLLSLYQKGKDKQWDAQSRIDWAQDVDPQNPVGLPDEFHPLFGSPVWEAADESRRAEMRQHAQAWNFSQFLHGEQGAMVCAAKIVEVVPDLDAKFYAATQTMDEARHVEAFSRFLQEKVGLVYPINKHLTALLEDTLRDSRWDMPYLGMQVLIEGLALAAFGVQRDLAAPDSLAKQVLAYVMQDEARHVAFGRISLKDYYGELSEAERGEREEFVVDACYLMRDRFRGEEVFETLGLPVKECAEWVDHSPVMIQFRSHLFSRIVPIVKDIGLWGERVQKAFRDMGVHDMAGFDIEALMKADEDQAEALDKAHPEMADRVREVDQVIAVGGS